MRTYKNQLPICGAVLPQPGENHSFVAFKTERKKNARNIPATLTSLSRQECLQLQEKGFPKTTVPGLVTVLRGSGANWFSGGYNSLTNYGCIT
jgi:hypothetical protein